VLTDKLSVTVCGITVLYITTTALKSRWTRYGTWIKTLEWHPRNTWHSKTFKLNIKWVNCKEEERQGIYEKSIKKYDFKKQQVKIVWRMKTWLWKRVNTIKASTNTRSKGQDEQITTTANNNCVNWGDTQSVRSGGKIEVEGKVRKKEKGLRRKIPGQGFERKIF